MFRTYPDARKKIVLNVRVLLQAGDSLLVKPRNVKYNFFSASGYVLNKYFSIYFCGWFGSSFSRIFLFQKSRKKPVLNRGFCATGADGSRVSTFVTLLVSSSGGRNTSEQFANHHQYLLIWLQLAGGGHSNNSPAGTKPWTVGCNSV